MALPQQSSAWFSELDTQPCCNSGGQHVPTAVSVSNEMEQIPAALLLPQEPREQRLHEAPKNSGEAGHREGVGLWKLWLWLALTSCCQEQGVVEIAGGQPLPL